MIFKPIIKRKITPVGTGPPSSQSRKASLDVRPYLSRKCSTCLRKIAASRYIKYGNFGFLESNVVIHDYFHDTNPISSILLSFSSIKLGFAAYLHLVSPQASPADQMPFQPKLIHTPPYIEPVSKMPSNVELGRQ